jgi:hypothetical protein
MNIIHIMEDGSIRTSVEGVVIPDNGFYQVLNGILARKTIHKEIKQ